MQAMTFKGPFVIDLILHIKRSIPFEKDWMDDQNQPEIF